MFVSLKTVTAFVLIIVLGGCVEDFDITPPSNDRYRPSGSDLVLTCGTVDEIRDYYLNGIIYPDCLRQPGENARWHTVMIPGSDSTRIYKLGIYERYAIPVWAEKWYRRHHSRRYD